jgi:aryl-alcohol dehydrogenase-like predicted oxidoreductase
MTSPAVPARPHGSTGEHVSCLGVGGAHLGGKDVTEDVAIRIIRTAIDGGIAYHEGATWITYL